jgi:hypothetical protein
MEGAVHPVLNTKSLVKDTSKASIIVKQPYLKTPYDPDSGGT